MRDDKQGAKRDIQLELKALRLNGMAAAWAELTAQGGDSTLDASRWLIEHLCCRQKMLTGSCARLRTR